jgi:hypothetical protein
MAESSGAADIVVGSQVGAAANDVSSFDAPTPRQNRIFFVLALGVFLLTRLWGLDRFPIFFFCDEAVQTVQAARLTKAGFRGEEGELLPTYFRNTEFHNLSIGVYLQVLPARLLPRSVIVARAVPLAVVFSAMLAMGWILRDFLKLRYGWVGVLVLSGFPGWFLHTRIAFELMLATAAYVWFLYFYLRYRAGRPRALFAAALFAALTFYGYNTFQPVIVATALLLAIVDAPFHWRNGRVVLGAVALAALLAWPYVRFVRMYSREVGERLRSLDSYWTDPARPLPEKLAIYSREYARAFDPRYWFRPDPVGDIARHTMKGYTHVPIAALPFLVAGIALCAWRIRSPGERTLLVALVCAPAGAAIVRSGITRAMILVVVFGMLVGVAADPLLRLLGRHLRPALVAAMVFLGLAVPQARMLADSLRNGPTWYREYGMYGMQWGAREVFGALEPIRKSHPKALVFVSPEWANGMRDLVDFFLPDADDVQMASVDWFLDKRQVLPDETLAVLTEDEYRRAEKDRRLDLRVEKTMAYPDGRPGFRFVWVGYSADFDTILAAEKERWHRLVMEDGIEVGGGTASVAHSIFDVGSAMHLFDGDDRSLVRTESANPAVVELSFHPPRRIAEVGVTIGSMVAEISLDASGPAGQDSFTKTYRDLPSDPTIDVPVPSVGGPVSKLRISVRDVNADEPEHVHLREIRLR